MTTFYTEKQIRSLVTVFPRKVGEVVEVDQPSFTHRMTVRRHSKKSTYGEVLYEVTFTYKMAYGGTVVHSAGRPAGHATGDSRCAGKVS